MRLENCIIAEALQIVKNILLLSLSDVANTFVMVAVCPTKVDLANGCVEWPVWLCAMKGNGMKPAGVASSPDAQRKLPRAAVGARQLFEPAQSL